MSQGFHSGSVSVIMSSCGSDGRVHRVAANDVRHGSHGFLSAPLPL